VKIALRWTHAQLIHNALDRKHAGENPLYGKIARVLKGWRPGRFFDNIEPQRNFTWNKEANVWEARTAPGFPETLWQFVGRNDPPLANGSPAPPRGPVVEFGEDLAKIVEDVLRDAGKASTRGGRLPDGTSVEPQPVISGGDADAYQDLLDLIIPAWKNGAALRDVTLDWDSPALAEIAALKSPIAAGAVPPAVAERLAASAAGPNGEAKA
jgi:hypothetical protein